MNSNTFFYKISGKSVGKLFIYLCAKLLNEKKKGKKQRILYSTLLEIPLNNNEKYVEKNDQIYKSYPVFYYAV